MSNTSRKLSSEEVSALMEGLKSGEINSGDGLNNDLEVASFTFRSDNLELMGDYYALRLINERFARMVRGIFLPMLRLQMIAGAEMQNHTITFCAGCGGGNEK